MHITILTIGSRGDVQPYLAFAVSLKNAGYHVRLATHAKFEQDIRAYGLEFALINGNPQDAFTSEAGQKFMQTKNPLMMPSRFAQALEPIMKTAIEDSWNACQGTDVIIAGSIVFWGFDIAQKLRVPFYYAAMQPFTATKEFPIQGTPPEWEKFGGWYNKLTYQVLNQIFWFIFRNSTNQFRHNILKMPKLGIYPPPLTYMKRAKINFLNAISPLVVPKPSDWLEHEHMTGYWFLDAPSDFVPPKDLVEFIQAGSPPVYIGFGSMAGKQAEKVAEIALAALIKTKQRGIFLTGWSEIENIELPENIFKISAISHDWLFPQMACIVHHGGAGTTAATFRAGVPGIIIPFLGDQAFWGYRSRKLGVSPATITYNKLNEDNLAVAIMKGIEDKDIRQKAAILGENIRAENGVKAAVEIIEKTLYTKNYL
ncbi:glycosyl transferase [Calothrix sp. HK-06]|nr:glycosyl transferase [Calothrix sp. HK-06]